MCIQDPGFIILPMKFDSVSELQSSVVGSYFVVPVKEKQVWQLTAEGWDRAVTSEVAVERCCTVKRCCCDGF